MNPDRLDLRVGQDLVFFAIKREREKNPSQMNNDLSDVGQRT